MTRIRLFHFNDSKGIPEHLIQAIPGIKVSKNPSKSCKACNNFTLSRVEIPMDRFGKKPPRIDFRAICTKYKFGIEENYVCDDFTLKN